MGSAALGKDGGGTWSHPGEVRWVLQGGLAVARRVGDVASHFSASLAI